MDVHSLRQVQNLPRQITSLFRKTALAGTLATSLLGTVHADDLEDGLLAYEEGRFQLAAKLLRPHAERGTIEAQVTLAKILELDSSKSNNENEAREWYQRAAESGDAEAQFCYGIMLSQDDELDEIIDTEAGYWLKQAASQGHQQASIVYESLLNENYTIGC